MSTRKPHAHRMLVTVPRAHGAALNATAARAVVRDAIRHTGDYYGMRGVTVTTDHTARLRAALQAMVDAHAIPSSICKARPAYDEALSVLEQTKP